MTQTIATYHPGLNRFAIVTAVAALLLIGLGGLVTSHEAGLAVPDWPTTFGFNMFLFPVHRWQGGVFFEHVHRLFASAVGLLTVALALALWWREERPWVRRLGWLAVVLVVVQGILGGLRVTEGNSQLGIVHAILAHLFLVLVSSLALVTSRTWLLTLPRVAAIEPESSLRLLARAYGMIALLVLLQLGVAATMRHQHAGLVVPDFPTVFGQWWPDLSAAAISRYNQMQPPGISHPEITAFRVGLQVAHRVMALAIVGGIGWVAWQTMLRLGGRHSLTLFCLGWVVLVLLQFGLGAATVWTGKAPAIATLHVVVGAATLVAGSLIFLLAPRLLILPSANPAGVESEGL
jgi:heme a synthase